MLEKALQDAGEDIATPSQISNIKANNKVVVTKKKEVSEKERKKKEEAAALLEKRKKYDPRKALKKAPKAKAKSSIKKDIEVQSMKQDNRAQGYDEIKVSET